MSRMFSSQQGQMQFILEYSRNFAQVMAEYLAIPFKSLRPSDIPDDWEKEKYSAHWGGGVGRGGKRPRELLIRKILGKVLEHIIKKSIPCILWQGVSTFLN